MNQEVLNQVIKSTIEWLTLPQTWAVIGYIAVKLPKIINSFKKAKKDEYLKIARKEAREITAELLHENFANDEKREMAVLALFKILPPDARKYISENNMNEIVNAAYHTYIKYNYKED